LDALDSCYRTLRKKVNDQSIIGMTDYNVFHTGGGYHIVKKAFDRLCRHDVPDVKGAEREEITEKRLHPSCHLLKRIGPCHTVSSFLNTASVCMSQMEQALGKVLCVFTYGSGCAASMYQMRFDDIAYFDPLEVWYLKSFYRNSIKVMPQSGVLMVHQIYVETWMQFDYRPHGRQKFGFDLNQLEDDVYYLGEIDKFGRRFYHRGGLKTGPIDKKWELPADLAEGRPSRKNWGPLPEKKVEIKDKSEEEIRRQIEYDMVYDFDADGANYEEVGEYTDTYKRNQKVKILKPVAEKSKAIIEPDGLAHSYQIVGTWAGRAMQDMQQSPDGSWTFEVILGENRWEEFYIIQDGDMSKRIYPHTPKAAKGVVTVGPHDGGSSHYWLLDGRDRVDVPEDQVGAPGDKYLVTFSWTKLKELTWKKLEGETDVPAQSRYYIAGTWTDFELEELMPDRSRRPGWFSTEVQMTSIGIEFKLARNKDLRQVIYPLPAKRGDRTAGKFSAIGGPDELCACSWKIDDSSLGGVYRISFYRDPEDCEPSAMRVEWTKVDDRPVKELDPTYYLIGPFNNWGRDGMQAMRHPPQSFSVFTGDIIIEEMAPDEKAPDSKKFMMPFKILQHKMPTRCVHPDKDRCTQLMDHKVVMDDKGKDLAWHIGAATADKAKRGDVFTVKLQISPDGAMVVSWAKAA